MSESWIDSGQQVPVSPLFKLLETLIHTKFHDIGNVGRVYNSSLYAGALAALPFFAAQLADLPIRPRIQKAGLGVAGFFMSWPFCYLKKRLTHSLISMAELYASVTPLGFDS